MRLARRTHPAVVDPSSPAIRMRQTSLLHSDLSMASNNCRQIEISLDIQRKSSQEQCNDLFFLRPPAYCRVSPINSLNKKVRQLAYLSSRRLPARSSNILLNPFVRAKLLSFCFITTSGVSDWRNSSKVNIGSDWEWKNERTESTLPNYMLPRFTFSLLHIPPKIYSRLRRRFHRKWRCEHHRWGTEGIARIVQDFYICQRVFTFGVAYKSESVPRACLLKSDR